MYARLLPTRGMPPRGSVQDRIMCAVLDLQRRTEISKSVYLARIISASSIIPEQLFQLWTDIFSSQLYHTGYLPTTIDNKKKALEIMESVSKPDTDDRKRMFQKLRNLEANDEGMRPMTSEEVNEIKRKLRRKRLEAIKK